MILKPHYCHLLDGDLAPCNPTEKVTARGYPE